jgi:DNA polymerase III epsilon subunit family exonuclease
MLDSTLSNLNFTALDIETTGLDSSKDKIIEIAAIRFNQEGLLNSFNFLINPGQFIDIPVQASLVNGITKKMLENAHKLDEIQPSFDQFIKDSVLVIQNAEFDLNFLITAYKQRNLDFPTLPVICTLNLTRKLYPNFKKHGLVHLRNYFKIDRMNKNTERHNFHEALDDSYAAMKVLIKTIEEKFSWNSSLRDIVYHPKNWLYSHDYTKEKWLF